MAERLADPAAAIRVVRRLNHWLVVVPEEAEAIDPRGCPERFGEILATPLPLLVGCGDRGSLPEAWRDWICHFAGLLAGAGKRTALVAAGAELCRTWSAAGRAAHVSAHPDLLGGLRHVLGAEAETSPMALVKLLVNAVRRVVRARTGSDCAVGRIGLKKSDPSCLLGDRAAIIEIVADGFRCGLILSLPEASLVRLAAALAGRDPAAAPAAPPARGELDAAVLSLMEAVHEQARPALAGARGGARMLKPYVARGALFEGFSFEAPGGALTPPELGRTVVVPLQAAIGPFYIEAWFPLIQPSTRRMNPAA